MTLNVKAELRRATPLAPAIGYAGVAYFEKMASVSSRER
jgi:hypothetical protein